MQRYKITIEYDGTRFNGWQRQPRQPKGRTVEGEIEKALSQVLQTDIDVIGQGRTDSGVHAEAQIAHFDAPTQLDKNQMLFAMLGVLPKDVAIYDLEEVADDFHSRFHAVGRQYRYQVVSRPSPIYLNYADMQLNPLDQAKLNTCAELIIGEHDFESFTKSSDEQSSGICTVSKSSFDFQPPLITYRIRGNRFLRHMVRRLVGTMLQVGTGKRTVEEFSQLLNIPRDDIGGHAAPAKGLFLERVYY